MLHTNNPIIKHKAGLLNLAEELGNVSKACKVMGVSRDTFYRYQELVEEGGLDNLINKSRRTPNPKNRVDGATEQAVIEYAVEQPAHGQVRASNELRKRGIFISPSGVRCDWTSCPATIGNKQDTISICVIVLGNKNTTMLILAW